MKNRSFRRAVSLLLAVTALTAALNGCAASPSSTSGTGSSTGSSSSSSSQADTSQKEAPMLAEKVSSGELPALEDRLPENPKELNELKEEHLVLEEGQYGGTLRVITTATNDIGSFLVGMMEPLVNSPSFEGDEFVANVAESFAVNEDASEYTFTLRKGMKWSDGEPVTTAELRDTLARAARWSVHSYGDSLRAGFLPLIGGHRLGQDLLGQNLWTVAQ